MKRNRPSQTNRPRRNWRLALVTPDNGYDAESVRKGQEFFEAAPIGSFVKIGFTKMTGSGAGITEWMWVLLEKRHGKICYGTLANDPCDVNARHGQRICFQADNVYQTAA